MALSIDPENRIIDSTASILDLLAFHDELRDWECSELGSIYPVTHTWKALPLGGGAFFYGCTLTNGWRLRFPNEGSYTIRGNLTGEIVPVVGVYVERVTSAAFSTTSVSNNTGDLPITEEELRGYFSQVQLSLNNLQTSTNALPDSVWNKSVQDNMVPGSFGHFIQKKLLTVAKLIGLR